MSTPVIKAKEDFLSVRNIEYFASGSLSSFHPSIEYSSEEEEEEGKEGEGEGEGEGEDEEQQGVCHEDQTEIAKPKVIDYELGLKNSENKESESLEKALSRIRSLEQALKQARMQMVKASNEEKAQQKMNLVLKENKELKADLVVYSNRLVAVEKVLKETKANLKKVEEQKNFLLCQIKAVCSKILSARNSEKVIVSSTKLFEDEFYLTVFEKIESLSRVKKINQGEKLFSPSIVLTPAKIPEDSAAKISQSLQTDPDLDVFHQKYWSLRQFGDQFLGSEKVVRSKDKKTYNEKAEVLIHEKFSYRNVFKDLKEIGSYTAKGAKKFEFNKKSVSVKSFMDSKIGSNN